MVNTKHLKKSREMMHRKAGIWSGWSCPCLLQGVGTDNSQIPFQPNPFPDPHQYPAQDYDLSSQTLTLYQNQNILGDVAGLMLK